MPHVVVCVREPLVFVVVAECALVACGFDQLHFRQHHHEAVFGQHALRPDDVCAPSTTGRDQRQTDEELTD